MLINFIVPLICVIAVLVLLVTLGFTGYILYLNKLDKDKIARLDAQIDSSRKEITSMSSIEVTVRNLDKKYNALKKILGNQKKYSLLLQELRTRKPSEITIDSLDLKEGRLNINGAADNYIVIAQYINNLLNKNYEGVSRT